MKKYIPQNDRLLVRRREVAPMSSGEHGAPVALAAQAQERPFEGDVVACGPKVKDYAEGEYVMYSKYAGIELDLDGGTHMCLREDEILFKIVETE